MFCTVVSCLPAKPSVMEGTLDPFGGCCLHTYCTVLLRVCAKQRVWTIYVNHPLDTYHTCGQPDEWNSHTHTHTTRKYKSAVVRGGECGDVSPDATPCAIKPCPTGPPNSRRMCALGFQGGDALKSKSRMQYVCATNRRNVWF